jgi:Zn-dependent protease
LLAIDFTQVFIAFLVLLFSLTVHEAAHAWTADRLGDRTARQLGRVSLNPAVHVDPIGTIVFPLISLLSPAGSFLIGWAKPVPVNTSNLHGHWQRKFMLIAAAGPASNLVMAGVAAVVLRAASAGGLLDGGQVASQATSILIRLIQLNVLLAVFNMLPIPPLDGGNVLAGLLRGSASRWFDRIRPYGFMLLYVLLFSGTLPVLIDRPSNFILSVLL